MPRGGRAKQLPEVGEHRFGLAVQLAPGDPDHAPAVQLKGPVAGTITLERGGRPMRGAVELGDQPVVGPTIPVNSGFGRHGARVAARTPRIALGP